MATIRGTARKNKLIGTSANDIILGLGGDDEIMTSPHRVVRVEC
jgi:hypothetical protein